MRTDNLATAREALAEGQWESARDAFESALTDSESPEAWDGLGRSLWWLRKIKAGIEARTRAYAEYRRQGRNDEAAVIAAWLAREHRNLYGNDAAADGWLARAERAKNQSPGSKAGGWILVARAEGTVDSRTRLDLMRRALEIAREQQDVDLEITSLARLGVQEISLGEVDSGVARLDEAMAAATAGEGRDPQSVGEAYCALMEAADLLGNAERIERWSVAFDLYRQSYDYLPLAGYRPSQDKTLSSFCGACCGGIFLVTGRLDQAESELKTAIAELESTEMQSRCVHPITQLAELRVLQGRLEEARILLTRYEDLPESVRPLSILDLALGSPETAFARLRKRLAELQDFPVVALPLWAVLVDAAIKASEVEDAEEAAKEIARVAALTKSGRHEGESLLAMGKVEAARGRPEAAGHLREAARRFSESSLSLLACRARFELAKALASTDKPVAISEARGALAGFERMGATVDADQASAFLRDRGVKGRTGPKDVGRLSKRETEVLRLVAEGFSNAEIAGRLFISVKTAGHHVGNILSKLGVRSRTEAAAYAVLHLGREEAVK